MKKWIVLLLAAAMLAVSTSCGKVPGETTQEIVPDASQMKAICELAVMECYYHNVAKYELEDAEGFWLWQKDRRFWIEYSGVVKMGVDVSLVNVEVEGTQVTITLPEAEVLGCRVDSTSLSEHSYIVDKQSASVHADDEIDAFEKAQADLEKTAANDRTLLTNAQMRVQELLEKYIENIGTAVEKTYTINWVYLDSHPEDIFETNGETVTPSQEPAA